MRTVLLVCMTALALLLALMAPRTALAAHQPHEAGAVRVGIVLFDKVQIIDFTGPYEVFGQAGFGVATVSANGKPVTTAMGLAVTPDYSFANAPAFDVLLVPGGDVDVAMGDAAVLDFVRQRSQSARHVLSVCTGAYILAATGLLDGLTATTFKPQFDGLAERFPKVTVVRDQRWVDNGKFITSAGLSSGIDAALHVVARLRGVDAARSAALYLEYDWNPDQGFVRGRLADRYLPGLKTVEWPQDLDAKTLTAIGNEHEWRMRSRVRSQTAADDLLQRMARGIEAEGWRRESGADGYRWQRDNAGQRLDLSITTLPGQQTHTYDLDIVLKVTDSLAR